MGCVASKRRRARDSALVHTGCHTIPAHSKQLAPKDGEWSIARVEASHDQDSATPRQRSSLIDGDCECIVHLVTHMHTTLSTKTYSPSWFQNHHLHNDHAGTTSKAQRLLEYKQTLLCDTPTNECMHQIRQCFTTNTLPLISRQSEWFCLLCHIRRTHLSCEVLL